MNIEPGQPRTPPFIRRFEVWFGGIFLAIGTAALALAVILFVTLSADPEMGNQIWAFLVSPLTVGIIFTMLGAFSLVRGLRQARKEERLLQHGTTAEATVTAVEQTSTRVNRRRLWRIRFVFDDLYGVPHEGQSGYLAVEEAQSYRVGEKAFVRYDPERPAESIWLGREEHTAQS
jgi:hypothetical protein